jgi:hypothetical protein
MVGLEILTVVTLCSLLIYTDISQKSAAYIIWVPQAVHQVTSSTLMMESLCACETSVHTYHTTQDSWSLGKDLNLVSSKHEKGLLSDTLTWRSVSRLIKKEFPRYDVGAYDFLWIWRKTNHCWVVTEPCSSYGPLLYVRGTYLHIWSTELVKCPIYHEAEVHTVS